MRWCQQGPALERKKKVYGYCGENNVDLNKKKIEVIILDIKVLSFKVRMDMFTVYNHTCGVSALCSLGCLQIQPKKEEMVRKHSIFVVNKWISSKKFVAKYTRVIQQYLYRKLSGVWPVLFSNTPASFLWSCTIPRLFSLRVNLLCFPRSQANFSSSGRYEQHFRRLFYAQK